MLIWFALRFHPRWLTLALILTSIEGIAGSIIAHATPVALNEQLLADEIYIGIIAAIFLVWPISSQAQDNSQFHEIETKYIFGTFTVGSSTGIEGEKAFEPETQANFGKRSGQVSDAFQVVDRAEIVDMADDRAGAGRERGVAFEA